MSKKEEKVVTRDEVAEPTAKVELAESADTPSKAEFKELMARYAEQNPVKFAAKKDRLEEKLKSL